MIIKKILKYFRKKHGQKQKITYTDYGSNINRCVSCGMVIPEGRQVCVKCEWGLR